MFYRPRGGQLGRRPEEHPSEGHPAVGTASAVVIGGLVAVPGEDAADAEGVVAAFQQAKDRSRGEGGVADAASTVAIIWGSRGRSLTAVATILSNFTILNTSFYSIY